MEQRFIDLTILSARDLKSVSLFGKNQPFAVAYVDRLHKCTTQVAVDGGPNPVWNEKHRVPVTESALQRGNAVLTVEIYSRGAFGNKIVGTVHIPVTDIMMADNNGASKFVTYQVERPSGKTYGSLSVVAKLTGVTPRTLEREIGYSAVASGANSHDDPVVAYPAYGSATNSGQPFSQPYTYPTPQFFPPSVNSYPPPYYPPPQYPSYYPPPNTYQSYPQGSYYPPVVAPPQRPSGNRFGNGGLGLGAGLLGGAVGGLLLGELASDMSYNSGYDQGLDASMDGGDWGVGF